MFSYTSANDYDVARPLNSYYVTYPQGVSVPGSSDKLYVDLSVDDSPCILVSNWFYPVLNSVAYVSSVAAGTFFVIYAIISTWSKVNISEIL